MTPMPPCDEVSVPCERRRLRRCRRGVALAVAMALLAGCSTSQIGDTQTGALGSATTASAAIEAGTGSSLPASRGAKVALLLPLTGTPDVVVVAKGLRQAAELAVFDLNSTSMQLMVKDDKGTPEGARAAAEEAVRAGAELIIGPLFSASVAAAAPVARANHIPVIAFSNDRKVAGQGVYLLSYLAEPEVERIVGYAAQQGKRGFAALLPQDAYGAAVEASFRSAVARHGGSIVAMERYTPDSNGMLAATKRVGETIKTAESSGIVVDALFVPGGEDIIPQLGSLLGYAGIDPTKVQLLGTGGWDYPNVGRDAALIGAWYPGPDPRGWQSFTERFAKSYGGPPPRLAALAYDAVSIASRLASGPAGQRYTEASLTTPAGFNGVDGAVRLLPGGLTARGLTVLEVQKFGASVIAPAGAPVMPIGEALPPVTAGGPMDGGAIAPLAQTRAPSQRELLPETN